MPYLGPDDQFRSGAAVASDILTAMLADGEAFVRGVGFFTIIHRWARKDDPTGGQYRCKVVALAEEALDVYAVRGNGPDGIPGRPEFAGHRPLDIAVHAIYMLSAGARPGDISVALAGLHDDILSGYAEDDQDEVPAAQPAPGADVRDD